MFQGNRVVDQNYDAALFQDLGSAPATMEASKAADFYGCVPGNDIQVADAEQAYVQAPMKGTPTWVALPREHYPEKYRHTYENMHRPVCRSLFIIWSPGRGHKLGGARRRTCSIGGV